MSYISAVLDWLARKWVKIIKFAALLGVGVLLVIGMAQCRAFERDFDTPDRIVKCRALGGSPVLDSVFLFRECRLPASDPKSQFKQ